LGEKIEIRLKPAPDEYRGDLSCICFLTPVTYGKENESPNECDVFFKNIKVGKLEDIYGNMGQGKLAAQAFIPEPYIEVVWED